MGEAIYSMIAEFPKSPDPKLQKAVRKFFLEGSRAEDFWQAHRGQTPEQFWPEFKKKHPTVTKYLGCVKEVVIGGDCNNPLAGNLDFGSAEDIKYQLRFHGRCMSYSAEIWHMADWSPLEEFLIQKFGAKQVRWGSEESGDTLDTIQLTMKNERLEAALKRARGKGKKRSVKAKKVAAKPNQKLHKYSINVCRIGYGNLDIEVMARNLAEAEQFAEDEAGNHSFSEHTSEYKSQGGLRLD